MTDMPMSEVVRRELADAHRDDAVIGSSPVEGRRLGQMVSLRLEPEVLSALRQIANERGVTVSDLLREGAGLVLEGREKRMQVLQISLGVEVGGKRSSTWDPSATPTRGAGSESFTAA